MLDWILEHQGIVLGFIVVVVLVSAGYLAYWDEQNWQAYAATHHCVAKGTKEGQTGIGIGTDSRGRSTTVITTTPSQTIYVCDEGEIRIR